MSYHVFSKYQISKVIWICLSEKVIYDISQGFFVVETKESGLDNIPTSVKNQINTDNLNPKNSVLPRKSEIASNVNVFLKIIIPTEMYDTYLSHYDDDRHVENFNEECKIVKQSLDELEHPSLITEWKNNTEKAAYK